MLLFPQASVVILHPAADSAAFFSANSSSSLVLVAQGCLYFAPLLLAGCLAVTLETRSTALGFNS